MLFFAWLNNRQQIYVVIAGSFCSWLGKLMKNLWRNAVVFINISVLYYQCSISDVKWEIFFDWYFKSGCSVCVPLSWCSSPPLLGVVSLPPHPWCCSRAPLSGRVCPSPFLVSMSPLPGVCVCHVSLSVSWCFPAPLSWCCTHFNLPDSSPVMTSREFWRMKC